MTVHELLTPLNTRAGSRTATADAKDLHWRQKRRPQQQTLSTLRRRIRPAVQNVVTAITQRVEAAHAQQPAEAASAPGNALRSQWVGRLRLGNEVQAFPLAVRKGQRLGQVEALSLSWPVLAPADGHVMAVLCAEGAVVEYAQPLFEFEEAATASLRAA